MRRLDHSTIFVFIAASSTPLALLVLTGPLQTAVLLLTAGLPQILSRLTVTPLVLLGLGGLLYIVGAAWSSSLRRATSSRWSSGSFRPGASRSHDAVRSRPSG